MAPASPRMFRLDNGGKRPRIFQALGPFAAIVGVTLRICQKATTTTHDPPQAEGTKPDTLNRTVNKLKE